MEEKIAMLNIVDWIFSKKSCRKRKIVLRRVEKVSNKCVFHRDAKANVRREDLPKHIKSCIIGQYGESRLTFNKDSSHEDEFSIFRKRSAREEEMREHIVNTKIKISINCRHKWMHVMIKMLSLSFVTEKQTKQWSNLIFLSINKKIDKGTTFLAIIFKRSMSSCGNRSKYVQKNML